MLEIHFNSCLARTTEIFCLIYHCQWRLFWSLLKFLALSVPFVGSWLCFRSVVCSQLKSFVEIQKCSLLSERIWDARDFFYRFMFFTALWIRIKWRSPLTCIKTTNILLLTLNTIVKRWIDYTLCLCELFLCYCLLNISIAFVSGSIIWSLHPLSLGEN